MRGSERMAPGRLVPLSPRSRFEDFAGDERAPPTVSLVARSSSPPGVELLLLDALIGLLIAAQYVYVLAFNLISGDLRLAVAGALFAIQLTLAAWTLAVRAEPWSLLIALALAIKLGCWAASIFSGVASSISPAELPRIVLRETIPYLAAIWLLSWPERLPLRLVGIAGAVAFAIAAVWAVTGEPIVLFDGSQRLAGFTGGESELGLHGSAYFILLSLFIFDRMRATERFPAAIAWPAIGLAVVLLTLYQVRTTQLMLAIYGLGYLWTSNTKRFIAGLGLAGVAALLAAMALMLVLAGSPADLQTWGSGRLGSYLFRLDLLSERDLLPLIFGAGPGSDVVVTPVWWWEAKDSHSDLFTTVVETGLVGLIGVAIFFAAIWSRLSPEGRPLLVALVASSAISNGLLVRPTEFFLLIIAMAVVERWRWEEEAEMPGVGTSTFNPNREA
jgi:hypothetical protein